MGFFAVLAFDHVSWDDEGGTAFCGGGGPVGLEVEKVVVFSYLVNFE